MGGGLAVSAMSNLNTSCIKLELGLGFDNFLDKGIIFWINSSLYVFYKSSFTN